MTGLLVIDIQNFYENMLVDFEKTSTNAGKIIDKFRKNKLLIFYIRHIKKIPVINKLISLEKMKEFQIHESVKPLESEFVIDKYFINCYRETVLLEKLKEKKINNLVICGMMTHMCVDAAVRASNDYVF
jgi:nicotinamidase-related amidase